LSRIEKSIIFVHIVGGSISKATKRKASDRSFPKVSIVFICDSFGFFLLDYSWLLIHKPTTLGAQTTTEKHLSEGAEFSQ
jgi:hypothetical protein